jgi:hypothetical protein
LFRLLSERWQSTCRFIPGDSLDAPHRKKQGGKTDEWFVVQHSANPIVKSIQVETATEYSSRSDLVE